MNRQVIERFSVQTDDGQIYKVERWQNYRVYSMYSGNSQPKPTTQELLTSCGMNVNEVDGQRFEILEIDKVATRIPD